MNKTTKIFIAFIVLLFLGMTSAAHAQISETAEVIVIDIIPDRPKPNSDATVRIQSFLIDLSRAVIDWRVDGVPLLTSGNEREVTIPLGEAGNITRVDVTARDESGAVFSKSITLRPASVDLVWEADSYTPPFYKGKALPGSRSNITIVAIPEFITASGVRIGPRELIYTWKHNTSILGSDSGRGKNVLTIEGPRTFGTTDIRVHVETSDGTMLAEEFLSIDAIQPFILFYEDDPLSGVRYEEAFESTFSLTKEEATIVAVPFYIEGKSHVHTDIEYTWRLNSETISTQGNDGSSITVRPEGGSGEATIQLTVKHLKYILQQARNAFTIRFDTSTESSIIPTL